jgi:hypothetical protein
MRPDSVEIKVSLSGTDIVVEAIDLLGLHDGRAWTIAFCEDVTGAAEATALLDTGVTLRARAKSGGKGDSTIKLRPCRWSQLHQDFSANRTSGDAELKIEADWAGDKHVLAASMTVDWTDSRLSAVQTGERPVASLFSEDQIRFLDTCADGRVELATVSALPTIAATRWQSFPVSVAGLELDVRAERWQIAEGLDFLELSIVSTVDQAPKDQEALMTAATDRSLSLDVSRDSKTQRVLEHLIARRKDS